MRPSCGTHFHKLHISFDCSVVTNWNGAQIDSIATNSHPWRFLDSGWTCLFGCAALVTRIWLPGLYTKIAWIYHKPENWNLLGWVPLFVRRYIMHSFCKVCVYGCSKHFEGKGAFFESSAILLPHPGFRQPCASLKFPAHSMVFINVVGTPGTTMWRWWWGWGAPRSPCSGSWSYLPHWGTPISFLVSRRPITKGLCSRVNVRGWLCCVIWTFVGLLLHCSCFHFQADWVWLRLNLQHPVCVEECPRQEGASQTRS